MLVSRLEIPKLVSVLTGLDAHGRSGIARCDTSVPGSDIPHPSLCFSRGENDYMPSCVSAGLDEGFCSKRVQDRNRTGDSPVATHTP